MRADARGSADTIYFMWRISLLCGPGIVNDVTKVGHTEYLLPTDCIIVLDSMLGLHLRNPCNYMDYLSFTVPNGRKTEMAKLTDP